MASNPIGRDGRPVTLPGTFPPMPAVARILARHDRGKLAAFVTVAIDLLDVMDGDDDAEPATWTEAGNRNTHAHLPDDYEQSGDEADTSWTEWPTRGRHKHTAGGFEPADHHEDDENDDPDTSAEDDWEGFDPEEDCCVGGDDNPADWGLNIGGMTEDDERQQMVDDVPCIPVVSLEPNIFNGQRQLLGCTLPRPTPNGIEAEP